jgi:hypothetical protein
MFFFKKNQLYRHNSGFHDREIERSFNLHGHLVQGGGSLSGKGRSLQGMQMNDRGSDRIC